MLVPSPSWKIWPKKKEALTTDIEAITPTCRLRGRHPVVRIQAARALCYLDQTEVALPFCWNCSTVGHNLSMAGTRVEPLYAATVLDEIDERARPSRPSK
ncbi:MAG: hypothetical protein R3C11_16885 [Planctomycetaceae bacterium]